MTNQLLTLSFFTNLISGFQFLVILNYFGSKINTLDTLKLTALALLLNRVGRLIAVTTSAIESNIFKKLDHFVYVFAFIFSALLSFTQNDMLVEFSALFLGIAMSGTTIAQRWRLTEVSNTRINLYFSILTTTGWGIGILLPSIFIYYKLDYLNLIIQSLIILPPLIISVYLINTFKTSKIDPPNDLTYAHPIYFDLRSEKSKYLYVFFSSFIVACAASIFNGTLIKLLKYNYQLNDLQVSLCFLFNLCGSLILFIRPKIIEGLNVVLNLAVFNAIFIGFTFLINLNLNIIFVFGFVFLIGTVITVSSTFQLNIIAIINKHKMSIRRIHILAEFFAIIGGAFVYFLSSASVDYRIQINFFFLLAILFLAVTWFSEYKLKNKDKFKLRYAIKDDLNFLINLYSECADPNIGQGLFPESRKPYFNTNKEIKIPLNPPLVEFTELVYYIIEDENDNKIGCITNLRNQKGQEEIGMLLTEKARGLGIGSNALLNIVALRKKSASRISGIIAESNKACLNASINAGAKIICKSPYLDFNQSFLKVEFYNKG